MKDGTRNGLLVGAGFLLGTVGIKALTSPAAKRCYVQGVAYGLRAKESYSSIVEEAKAQLDDIVAEASYINSSQSFESEEQRASEDVVDAASNPEK
mgnify:FL=1